jgi:hypothetical protein
MVFELIIFFTNIQIVRKNFITLMNSNKIQCIKIFAQFAKIIKFVLEKYQEKKFAIRIMTLCPRNFQSNVFLIKMVKLKGDLLKFYSFFVHF